MESLFFPCSLSAFPSPKIGLGGSLWLAWGNCGVEHRYSAGEDVAKAGSWEAAEMSLAAEKV